MRPNAIFNKNLHQEDTDAEHAADLQHQALAKMAQGVEAPVPPPAVTAPVAPAPPSSTALVPHPIFPGLHAVFHPGSPAGPVKIAPAAPRKPFQRRI